MKPQIIEVFGLYNTDDRGYSNGDAIGFWPINAAAESQKTNGYQTVNRHQAIKFDDTIYLLGKEIRKEDVIGRVKALVPTECYLDYVYESGFDKSKYIIEETELIKALSVEKSKNIRVVYILRDTDDNYFILSSPIPITVEKIIPSRELAIVHALSKLTDEEKKLLGLT